MSLSPRSVLSQVECPKTPPAKPSKPYPEGSEEKQSKHSQIPAASPREWCTPERAIIISTPDRFDRSGATGYPAEMSATPKMSAIPKMPAGFTGSASGSASGSDCLSAVQVQSILTPAPMPAGLQASKEEIDTFFTHPAFEFLRNQCLGRFNPGDSNLSNPETSELRFHREPKIDRSQAFKLHILVDFMMIVEKTDKYFDRQQVLDLSLVKEQGGQLKLLLFSNLDSPLLSNLCGIISDQYGIPIEYPQLDPKNYDLNEKKKSSIAVALNMELPGGAVVKTLSKDEKEKIIERYREAGRKDDPEGGALHAEQRAQQYINPNSNLNLVHHVNTQTSFCDENVLMRHKDTVPVLKFREDWVLSEDLSGLVDRLIQERLNSGGKKSGISGREVVRQIVNSFFDNVIDIDVDALNQTIQEADSSFQRNSFFNASNVEKILGQAKKPNGEINFEDPRQKIMTLLEGWKSRLGGVPPERIINDQLLQQNARDKIKGSCQCCRIALRSGKGSAGSFIQDISGEIPGQFAQKDGVFEPVVLEMVEKRFLVSPSSEDKPEDKPGKGKFVFTKQYADRALDHAGLRESFIANLAMDLNVETEVLTSFFNLGFFTHLRKTEVPWPLPKGRQSRTLPLDHDKIINTAMLGENRGKLDLKALLGKRSTLNKTGALTILDTGDAEREGVSEKLAYRLGASLLNEGESGGNNAVQIKYVLNCGAESPSTYNVSLEHMGDGNLGISKIDRVGVQGSIDNVFSALSPSDREGQ